MEIIIEASLQSECCGSEAAQVKLSFEGLQDKYVFWWKTTIRIGEWRTELPTLNYYGYDFTYFIDKLGKLFRGEMEKKSAPPTKIEQAHNEINAHRFLEDMRKKSSLEEMKIMEQIAEDLRHPKPPSNEAILADWDGNNELIFKPCVADSDVISVDGKYQFFMANSFDEDNIEALTEWHSKLYTTVLGFQGIQVRKYLLPEIIAQFEEALEETGISREQPSPDNG